MTSEVGREGCFEAGVDSASIRHFGETRGRFAKSNKPAGSRSYVEAAREYHLNFARAAYTTGGVCDGSSFGARCGSASV